MEAKGSRVQAGGAVSRSAALIVSIGESFSACRYFSPCQRNRQWVKLLQVRHRLAAEGLTLVRMTRLSATKRVMCTAACERYGVRAHAISSLPAKW